MQIQSILPKIFRASSQLVKKKRIAIDLGTDTTRIAIHGKGIVLREPSYVAYNQKAKEYLFFGEEAKDIHGKAPKFVTVTKPIQCGIISDFDAAVYLVQKFMNRAVYPYFRNSVLVKPAFEVYTTVPTSATEVEQRAIEEALVKSGISSVKLIEKPLAAAYGAGQAIFTKKPHLVIDMGAGIVEMAVIIMGGIVTAKTLNTAGDHMDKVLKNYLHLKYGLIIGDRTAETLKKRLLSLTDSKEVMTIRGKSLESGLPKSTRVTANDVREALVVTVNAIIDGVKELIETMPPETVDGIIRGGIMLTGELATIQGIDRYITREVKIPTMIATRPQDATIHGLMRLIDNSKQAQKIVL